MTGDEVAAVGELRESVERLATVVTQLSERVTTTETVLQAVNAQSEERKRQRRVNGWLAASIAFDVALSVAFGFGLLQLRDNTHDINDVQVHTSSAVLCPLYELLVSQADALTTADADANQDGTVTDQEQADLDHTVEVIRAGYAALGCKHLK